MYDGLRFIVCDDTFCSQLAPRLSRLSTTLVDEGIKSEHGWLGEFDVTIRNGRRGKQATFRGSLHKYFLGENAGMFTLSDVSQAIDRLRLEAGLVYEPTQITRLEFGVNIICENPKSIIDSALLYKGKTGRRSPSMKVEDKVFDQMYKEWKFSEYTVKLYAKGSKTLRYEFHYDFIRFGIKDLSHLQEPQKMAKCIDIMLNGLERFTFVPNDREGRLPSELSMSWGEYRAESFWEDLSVQSSVKKSRTIKKIKNAILEYGLIDWHGFLMRKIQGQIPEILGNAGMKYWSNATKSILGLLSDSVAGQNEACNRQTEKDIHPDGGIYIYTICIHSVTSRHHLPMHQRRHVGSHDRRVTGCHQKRAPPYSPKNERFPYIVADTRE